TLSPHVNKKPPPAAKFFRATQAFDFPWELAALRGLALISFIEGTSGAPKCAAGAAGPHGINRKWRIRVCSGDSGVVPARPFVLKGCQTMEYSCEKDSVRDGRHGRLPCCDPGSGPRRAGGPSRTACRCADRL